MSNSYCGETPAKASERARAYQNLSRAKLLKGYHVVIASTACGDIKHLKSLGVPANQIIACDRRDIIATTQWALEMFGGKLASVNVDLCMTLPKGLPILKAVLKEITKSTLYNDNSPGMVPVFFTFLRGRDSNYNTTIPAIRSLRRSQMLLNELAWFRIQGREVKEYKYQSPSPMSMVTLLRK